MLTNKLLLIHIEEILRIEMRPLSIAEILKYLENKNQSPDSKNPKKYISTKLSNEIKKNKKKSIFMKTEPGKYTLRRYDQFPEYTPPPKEKKYSEEFEDQLLVISNVEIDKIGYFHGLRTDRNDFLPRFFGLNSDILKNNLLSENIRFKWKKRNFAEHNFQYKQLTVYVLVKYKDQIIRYSRGKGTSLKDNMGEYSLGFGGHVELKDQNLFMRQRADSFAYACLEGVRREIYEEIGIDIEKNQKDLKVIGLINDDSVKQGLQHIALVLLLELSYPEVHKTEKYINQPHFIDINNLANEYDLYEYWSQLCIQALWGNKLGIKCQILPNQVNNISYQSEIILIVGFINSGKTTACNLLEKEFDYFNIRCSRVMQEIIGCGPIEEIGRTNLQNAGYSFIRNEDGHNKLAQGILKVMSENPGRRFVLDGLRYPDSYTALVEKLNKPISMIYIDTLIENSWIRYNNNNIYTKKTFNNYLTEIYHPVEKSIQKFRPIADIVIHNNGSLNSYLSCLREFFTNEIKV